jgi:hypothetical protein
MAGLYPPRVSTGMDVLLNLFRDGVMFLFDAREAMLAYGAGLGQPGQCRVG